MRKTILSRSVVAVATLAIGSVALAATPATAATASGITRDQILTAVNGVRTAEAAAEASDSSPRYSVATARALRAIVLKGCDIDVANDEGYESFNVELMNGGDDAEGLVVNTYAYRPFSGGQPCTIAAVATADASFQLSGAVTFSADRVTTEPGATEDDPSTTTTTRVTVLNQALSGDAFVTAPFDGSTLVSNENTSYTNGVAAAVGNATKTTVTKTSVKVKDKKTKSEKAKAKAKYTKKIKSVKKSYAKALDKAGSSKSKKAAAKKVYKAKRAAAKAAYKYAIAGFKLVKKSTSNTENRPFSIKTAISES